MPKRYWLQYQFNNTAKIELITFFSSLYIYSHVGTLYLQERGLNLLQVNSIWSIIVGTMFVVEVPTGIIADRIGRKQSIIVALAFQVLGEVLYLFSRSYWAFVLISIIAGVGFAFLSGCVEALVYDSLEGEDREQQMKKAMGLNGMAFQFAFFLAPILGSLLVPIYTLDRFLIAVFLTACSVGVALLIACTLVEPSRANVQAEALANSQTDTQTDTQTNTQTDTQTDTQSSLALLRDGVQHLRGSRLLQWLLLIGVFTATFSAPLVGLYQPYFAQFHIEAFWMGIAFAIAALVAGISERYVYKLEEWLGARMGLFMTTILPGLFYILFGLVTSIPAVFLLFILTYSTTTLKNPLLSAYQNELIHSENRATVLSLINLVNSLYVAVMTLAMGWLADIQISYGFIFVGVIIVVATVVLRVDRVGLYQGSVQPSEK
ncbi:MAG: MFS transporter [Chloroflexota bacterium]